MILSDFFKALAQIGDPVFARVLLLGVGLAIALLAGLIWIVQLLLPEVISLPLIGQISWLSQALSGAALIGSLILSVFLMVPVASIFVSMFQDQIAGAVEARHYAHHLPARKIPISEICRDALGFLALICVVNGFALAIYFASTLLAPVIFWIVNGILLGREYFQVVALRHMDRAAAHQMRAKHRLQIWFAGMLMAVPLTVPLLNLVVPVLGVATFTHLFHRLNNP